MTIVTGKQVWDQLIETPQFGQQTKKVQDVYLPYIMALPTILRQLSNEPATLSNLILAKITFMNAWLSNGSVFTIARKLGYSEPRDLYDQYINEVDALTKVLDELPLVLEAQRKTEEEFMLSPRVGLIGEAMKKCQAGTLTIGELLVLQPMVILDNDQFHPEKE